MKQSECMCRTIACTGLGKAGEKVGCQRLNHPNIIRLKDYFLYAGKLVLVTEYIEGIDLQSYLDQQGKLSQRELKLFMSQMASALSHAHTNNIIHRDLKLSNILVTEEDHDLKFVLVDFGISRMAEGIQTIKRVAGTYYYMAPEQLRGRPCEQSDLWALGIMRLYFIDRN